MSNDELKIDDVVPEIVDRGTAAGDPTPNVPKEIKRRGRGVDLSTLDPEALKLHKKAINQKTRKKAKDAKDKTAAAYNSPAEPTKNEALQILGERGIRNEHIQNAVYKMLLVAALNNRIVANRFLFQNGLQQTLASMEGRRALPLELETPDDYPEGELSTRAELHAIMDAFWKEEPITFEQWLADRLRLKSSAFELSKILGKEDFGRVHEEWTNFAPGWSPIGLKPNYTLREALTWLNAHSETKRYLLVASRNSMKSTWARIFALCLTITCPDAPILIVSETNKLSRKAMREFRGYLELKPNNPTLFQQYFGEFTVSSEDSGLTYENPMAHLGLPQIACESSSMESANTGSRFWLAIYDDPISRDNGTSNDEQRAAAISKHGSIMKLRDPAGYALNVQTPWVVGDLGDVMIKRNQEDPERPLAVRIDPVMTIKPEAKHKPLLELREEDVVLNFLPKLNWKFVRDEMRSPEGINFFKTQYLCEWIEEDEGIKCQFTEAALRARLRPRSFFDATCLPGTPVYMALDTASSTSRFADFSAISISRVQLVVEEDKGKRTDAMVLLSVDFGRWKSSEIIEHVVKAIELHKPAAWALEKDRGHEDLILGVRKQCLLRNLVMPHVVLRDIKNTPQAKALKVKSLESPLEDSRYWLAMGPHVDMTIAQFVRFDGVKKSGSSDGSKDDIPDSCSLAFQIWGPRALHEKVDPEEQKARREEDERELEAEKRRLHYNRMFGHDYVPPPKIEIEPQQPKSNDPRLRLFGNKSPWRL